MLPPELLRLERRLTRGPLGLNSARLGLCCVPLCASLVQACLEIGRLGLLCVDQALTVYLELDEGLGGAELLALLLQLLTVQLSHLGRVAEEQCSWRPGGAGRAARLVAL
jgi:hypothetical protein